MIKEMSAKTLGDQPRVLLSDIAGDLSIPPDLLLVFLAELEGRGLIVIHKTGIVSVSLTKFGVNEKGPGGF